MPEESTTPDLAELWRQAVEAGNRRDVDALISFLAPDVVWDAGIGTFEGAAAVRSLVEDWLGAYEELRLTVEEAQNLDNGVTFGVGRQDGRLAGSTGSVQERVSWTCVWTEGRAVRVVVRRDIDEARAAAERLAEERG